MVRKVQVASGAHPAPLSKSTAVFFSSGLNRSVCETDHSPLSICQVCIVRRENIQNFFLFLCPDEKV
jgi:hypothetical protein